MATLAQIDLMHEGVLTGLPLPITVRPSVPISDDDLLALSRRNQTYRIERNAKGELEIMSPSGGKGGRWESRVIRELDVWTERNGGVSFSSSTGFHLPDGSVLSPDDSWVSQERWDALSDREQRRFPPICPEFVIEILSETDSRSVLETKMQLWMDNGAQLAWMIDPYEKTVRIYRAGEAVELLIRPDSVEAGEPVAGFRLSMLTLWDK